MAVEVVKRGEQAAGDSAAPPGAVSAGLSARIQKRLRANGSREFVLDVQLAIPPGITILFGASGAGKTTLLDCLAGLLEPDAGRIALRGGVLFDKVAGVNLPTRKRSLGYVFQDLALFPHLTVEGNIRYGLGKIPGAEQSRRTAAILQSLRASHLQSRYPGEISGGERQRVALARALVTDPELLLLDEPLGGLDAPTKSAIVDDLRAWNRAHQIPIIYVTHDRGEVFALGERAIVLEAGRLVAQGTPHEVLNAPRQEAVAQLAGFENIFDATVDATHEAQGTMTCRLAGTAVTLEVPLSRVAAGGKVRVAVRAGDILLATTRPQDISARNIIPGVLLSLEQRDFMITAQVDCGIHFEVHLTPGARDSLQLHAGREVWLVLKTHSCQLVMPST
ncbi:MAG TPA: molybdenum ABC transporter ATP-binding protein [Terriglobales bacterium]|nr:molybdenum ABC transporter ATP-binding protein [Terriglobales bacterium]